jgi:hypothetical protein
MTRENSYYESLDCSVSFFGVVHTSDELEAMLSDDMSNYKFDSILFEEHISNGFDPTNVSEHRVIREYANNNPSVNVRSMDVPMNSEHIDSLSEVMTDLSSEMPNLRTGELTSENGMVEFTGRYEAQHPRLYTFAHAFRNDRMSIEIINEARKQNVRHISVIVGKTHIFGSDSIMNKLDQNLNNRHC